MSDKLEELIKSVASGAENACSSDFAREENRVMNEEEQNISSRASYLAVKWTSTQPVSRFLEEENDREELNDYYQTKRQRRQVRKKVRREKKRKFDKIVQDCKEYVENNWEGEGVGFIFALLSAIVWHLIVVLIVRWIVLRYFDEPELAVQICVPNNQ